MEGPSTSTWNITHSNQTTNSLAVDDINDSAELSKVRSIVNVGNTSNLNKASENLETELEHLQLEI